MSEHDIPRARHLGIKKTRERILEYFFLGLENSTTKSNTVGHVKTRLQRHR